MLQISQKQAKRIALSHQGLLKRKAFAKREAGLLQVLDQLSYIQIDTISVITRAHHHTLWTRVPQYEEEMLYALQREGSLFEYWSHAAAYLPWKNYRFTLPKKHALSAGEKHWYERDLKVMQFVLDRIKAEGPLQSKDFQSGNPRSNQPWYQWKPTKRALEQLFMEGKLMVAERRNFQKVFDLTERVLPSEVDTRLPSESEMSQHLIHSYLSAHGIGILAEIGYLRKGRKKGLATELQVMLEAGEIVPVQVKGIEALHYALPTIENQLSLRIGKKQLHLLSPFDNTVIQRKRLQQLFDFQYQIECYVPKPKRKFGYFCLPILWGDEFVGKLDCKADRKTNQFLIQKCWLEASPKTIAAFLPELAKRLQAFATFHKCEKLILHHCFPASFESMFRQLLSE